MKKRSLLVLFLTVFMILKMTFVASAAQAITVVVNGKLVSFSDQKPYIDRNGRTMVPVRSPMEAMGCTVSWDNVKQQATITKGITTAVFTVNSKTYIVNGIQKTMDTKAVIVNSRTAFPIRFAAEAMGATVVWDASTYTVLITKTGNAEVKTVDLGRSSDAFKEDNIQVGDYTIHINNTGVDDRDFWFGITDTSYLKKNIRVVCTSNPEWNENNRLLGDGSHMVRPQDGWTNSFTFFKDGYSPVNPKSGDKVTFDVYGKVNGQETKLVTITKTLP